MANIAEGFERDGHTEFRQFLSLAKGSCGEARSLLYVAMDADYISAEQFDDLSSQALEISKMLNGFMKYLTDTDNRGRKYSQPKEPAAAE